MSGRELHYVPSTAFQRNIAATLRDVAVRKQATCVTEHGREMVVLLAPERYAELLAIESAAAWDRALAPQGGEDR